MSAEPEWAVRVENLEAICEELGEAIKIAATGERGDPIVWREFNEMAGDVRDAILSMDDRARLHLLFGMVDFAKDVRDVAQLWMVAEHTRALLDAMHGLSGTEFGLGHPGDGAVA